MSPVDEITHIEAVAYLHGSLCPACGGIKASKARFLCSTCWNDLPREVRLEAMDQTTVHTFRLVMYTLGHDEAHVDERMRSVRPRREHPYAAAIKELIYAAGPQLAQLGRLYAEAEQRAARSGRVTHG